LPEGWVYQLRREQTGLKPGKPAAGGPPRSHLESREIACSFHGIVEDRFYLEADAVERINQPQVDHDG